MYDVVTDGTWHNTGKAPDTDSVELQDYAKKEELTELNNNFNSIQNDIARSVGIEKSGTKTSGLLTETGTAINGSWTYSDYVSFDTGDIFIITITQAPGSPYVPLQIYDENKTIVENIKTNYNGIYKADKRDFTYMW